MHIAGFKLPLSPLQWVEVFVVLSTAEYFRYIIVTMKGLAAVSESKGGRIKPESMPSTLLGRVITPIHAFAIFIPPLVYIGALLLNGFRQPEWIAKFTLSSEEVESAWGSTLRVAACVSSLALKGFTNNTLKHLGEQWHAIGRRKKSRIVKTGPYAWVRHPLYSLALIQEVLWTIMFWSYIPFVALGVTAFAFAVKMPIEESLILKDNAVRDEYQQYIKEVPARIVPFIW